MKITWWTGRGGAEERVTSTSGWRPHSCWEVPEGAAGLRWPPGRTEASFRSGPAGIGLPTFLPADPTPPSWGGAAPPEPSDLLTSRRPPVGTGAEPESAAEHPERRTELEPLWESGTWSRRGIKAPPRGQPGPSTSTASRNLSQGWQHLPTAGTTSEGGDRNQGNHGNPAQPMRRVEALKPLRPPHD